MKLSLLHAGQPRTEAAPASDQDEGGALVFGVVDGYNAQRYYDPAAPPSSVKWRSPSRALAAQETGAVRSLTLPDGASVSLEPGKVDGAVKLVLRGPAPEEGTSSPQPVLTRVCLGVAADEVFYGFGETFDRVASRGVVRPMQLLVDGEIETGLNEVHVPVPVAISPRGWGMIVEDFHAGAFDVAKARDDRICASFTTNELTVHLMTGPPLQLVERPLGADRQASAAAEVGGQRRSSGATSSTTRTISSPTPRRCAPTESRARWSGSITRGRPVTTRTSSTSSSSPRPRRRSTSSMASATRCLSGRRQTSIRARPSSTSRPATPAT